MAIEYPVGYMKDYEISCSSADTGSNVAKMRKSAKQGNTTFSVSGLKPYTVYRCHVKYYVVGNSDEVWVETRTLQAGKWYMGTSIKNNANKHVYNKQMQIILSMYKISFGPLLWCCYC